ncbi:MAG: protein O-mannosyl-transferase family [Thermoplasmatota archaeon]
MGDGSDSAWTRPRLPWARLDLGLALGLAVASVLAHLPYRSRHLNTWDSVLFALALDRYSVPEARPHPPGYPVYIAMAKLLQPFFADENATLVALSLAMAAATGALLYAFVRSFGSRRAALAAGGLLAASPILAHNAVIATSYAGESLFTILVAWASWACRRSPTTGRAALLGATFLLAIGFRQSFLLYLTPLVAWALLPRPWDVPILVRRLGAAAAAGLVVGLLWLVPMVALSGGWGPYSRATSLQTGLVVFAESVFTDGMPALTDHWSRFEIFFAPEARWVAPVFLALLLAGGWAVRRGRRRAAFQGHDSKPSGLFAWPPELGTFLALWSLPAALFYLLVFNGWDRGPDGYALVLLPPIYFAVGLVADACIRALPQAWGHVPMGRAAAAMATVLLVLPAAGLVGDWDPLLSKEVQEHDEWTESWLGLYDDLPPNGTAIVASYSWAHVKWFFPDYILWSYMGIPSSPLSGPWALTMETRHHEDDVSFYEAHYRGPDGSTHPIPDGIERIVVFDFQLAGENDGINVFRPEVEVKEHVMANGWRILYFETDAEHPTIESYFEVPGNTAIPSTQGESAT